MVSSLEDMKLWARALGRGDLISEAMQQRRLETVQDADADIYGLGLAVRDGFVGHNGAVPGYSTEIRYWPGHNAIMVVLMNTLGSDTGAVDVCEKLTDILLEEITGTARENGE
jgi:D-alanyl-D-alanine carboxypeptidase